jgi:plasmid stability protein
MARVVVRNLDDAVLDRLSEAAKRRGHTLEEELREILTAASQPSRAEIIAEMDRIRAMTPKKLPSDSTDLIREDRDRGWR